MKNFINHILALNKTVKVLILFSLDFILVVSSFFASYFLRLESFLFFNNNLVIIVFYDLLLFYSSFFFFGIYSSFIRFQSTYYISRYLKAILIYSIIFFILTFLIKPIGLPRSLPVINGFILSILVISSRFLIIKLVSLVNKEKINAKTLLIYGAGKLGSIILKSVRELKLYKKIIFIDDDKNKIDRSLDGIKIFSANNIEFLKKKFDVNEAIIAFQKPNKSLDLDFLSRFTQNEILIKSVPNLFEMNYDHLSYGGLKEINPLDFVSSKIAPNNKNKLSNFFKDEIILITGGGGSIGSELSRQISLIPHQKIYILDFSEYNLYKIQNDILNASSNTSIKPCIEFILSDLNIDKLEAKISEIKPTIIFHAAAYKHVPIVEHNPIVSVDNNFISTVNIVNTAIKFNVTKFIYVSTDKAVEPNNIMGASKKLSEIYIRYIANKHSSKFSIVRFGNVVGSSGSVIPLFIDQIKKGGPITVTHEEVTRYFMTIPDAASLILNASLMSKGGEIFVLNMGNPKKIIDIANDLINYSFSISKGIYSKNDIKIKIIGLRDGEKIHEKLFEDDSLIKTTNDDILISKESDQKLKDIDNIIDNLKIFINQNNKQGILNLISKYIYEK